MPTWSIPQTGSHLPRIGSFPAKAKIQLFPLSAGTCLKILEQRPCELTSEEVERLNTEWCFFI